MLNMKYSKKPNYYYSMINYNKQNNLLCHVTNVKFIEYNKDDSIPMIIISVDKKFKFLEKLDDHKKYYR